MVSDTAECAVPEADRILCRSPILFYQEEVDEDTCIEDCCYVTDDDGDNAQCYYPIGQSDAELLSARPV